MAAVSPFLFGKLPAHGDFIARGLSQPARQAWDDWASGVLQRMLEVHGDGFEAAHDAIQPWRFVAGPSRYGEDWRAGALAPSIDSAGRRFLVLFGVQGWSPARAAALGLAAADGLEGLIYQAIGEGLNADAVMVQLQAFVDDLELLSATAADRLAAQPAAAGVWWSTADASAVLSAEPPAAVFAASSVNPLREFGS